MAAALYSSSSSLSLSVTQSSSLGSSPLRKSEIKVNSFEKAVAGGARDIRLAPPVMPKL